jgi:hypothetical protein
MHTPCSRASVGAKDQGLRQPEESQAQEHQRMLLEIDRPRQATKSVEAKLDLERQRRVREEGDDAQRLAEAQGKLKQLQDDSRVTSCERSLPLKSQRLPP